MDGADDLFLSARLEGATTIVRRGRPGRAPAATTRWLGIAIGVVMVLGVGALVTRARGPIGPDAALAAAQAAVEGDYAYRVTMTLTAHSAEPEDGESADSGATAEAVIVSPERWKALDAEFDGEESYETSERRRVDGDLFIRERGSGATRWQVADVQPPPDEAAELAEEYEAFQDGDYESADPAQRRLVLAFYAHILPISYDPAQVERFVLQATEPVLEERLDDGGVRLQVAVAPLPEIAAVADDPIAPMDLVLDLDDEHRPRAARFHLEEAGDSLTLELEFSDWGASLTVDPPTEDDVERTPWVDEEELADVDPSMLLLPAEVPDGLELVSVEVHPEEDDEACRSVDIEYATRAALEAQLEDYEEYDGPELSLTVTPLACELYDPDDFSDELGGRPAYLDDGYTEVLVGDLVVELYGTLDDEELEPVVASLEELTPAEVLVRFPSWLPEVVQSRYA